MNTDYNSFIEVFAVSNLAYAGTEIFNELFSDKIERLDKKCANQTEELAKELELLKGYLPEMNPQDVSYTERLESMIKPTVMGRKLVCRELFRNSFFITGIYCLVALVCLASLQNGLHVKESKVVLFNLTTLIWIVNFYIFLISFTEFRNGSFRRLLSIIIVTATIFISFILAKYDFAHLIEGITDHLYFIYVILITTVAPVLLNAFRSIIIYLYVYIRYRSNLLIIEIVKFNVVNTFIYSDQNESMDISITRGRKGVRLALKIYYAILWTILKHRFDKRAIPNKK